MNDNQPSFEQWAILELLGHVRLGGLVTEEEHFGAKLGRIDVPTSDGRMATQWFGALAIYRLTPTTEEIARAVALRNQPAPVHRWELPPAREETNDPFYDEGRPYDCDDEGDEGE